MKNFKKALGLVLAFTLVLSMVVMPAYAKSFPVVEDISNYVIDLAFVDSLGQSISSTEADSDVYVALTLKNFQTLGLGYVTVALSNATFVSEDNKLASNSDFDRDSDLSSFTANTTSARFGFMYSQTAQLSTNGKAKYVAFGSAKDVPLAVYKVKTNSGLVDGNEVTATVSEQNLKLGDASGATEAVAIAATTTVNTSNASVSVGSQPGPGPQPVITYEYDAELSQSEFTYPDSDATILSKVVVTKYELSDGVRTGTSFILQTGDYTARLSEDGGNKVVSVSVPSTEFSKNLIYTYNDLVEYKNVSASIGLGEFDYDAYVADGTIVEKAIEVTADKYINEQIDSQKTFTLGEDYTVDATLTPNENAGTATITFIGDYSSLSYSTPLAFTLINPKVTYSDIIASFTEDEFPSSVTENDVESKIIVNANKTVGFKSPVPCVLVKDSDYTVTVDLIAKTATITYDSSFEKVDDVLNFTITESVITYGDAPAGSSEMSSYVFTSSTSEDAIKSAITVKAQKYVDSVPTDIVTVTSDNYDVQIDIEYVSGSQGTVTVSFKNDFAALTNVVFDIEIQDSITYGDINVEVTGAINKQGKEEAEIKEDVWNNILASREKFVNGISVGTENLDKAALEGLGVTVELFETYAEVKKDADVLATIKFAEGLLQFKSNDSKVLPTQFVKGEGKTLSDVLKNVLVMKDVFEVIKLSENEDWISLYDAISSEGAEVTCNSVVYKTLNIADADSINVSAMPAETVLPLDVLYSGATGTINVELLDVASDVANEEDEVLEVMISVDKEEVKAGTDVVATAYVDGLADGAKVEIAELKFVVSNAAIKSVDACDGFYIPTKDIAGNTVSVTVTKGASDEYNPATGLVKITLDTTDSVTYANAGVALSDVDLSRIKLVSQYSDFIPLIASIGSNATIKVNAQDVEAKEYEVKFNNDNTSFYTVDEAKAAVKVTEYDTLNGVRTGTSRNVPNNSLEISEAANNTLVINYNNARLGALSYTLKSATAIQEVAIETLGAIDESKIINAVSVVSAKGTITSDCDIQISDRKIIVKTPTLYADSIGTVTVSVNVPGYTHVVIPVAISKDTTEPSGFKVETVEGCTIYAGDINGDNRIDAVDFSSVAGKFGTTKEALYDLYTANDAATIDAYDITTVAYYFTLLQRTTVSEAGLVNIIVRR